MATTTPEGMGASYSSKERPARRLSTETKASTKTTELMAYIGAVVAVIITALVVGKDGHGVDPFSASEALHLITYLTIGYMVARGLAKCGSRDNYDG